MMKRLIYFKGGLAAIVLLLLSSTVLAEAGNVYVDRSLLSSGTVRIYSGARVNQNGGGSTLLREGGTSTDNYTVNATPVSRHNPATGADVDCTCYSIFNAPGHYAYLLFENGSQYSIVTATLDPQVPPDNDVFSPLRWYTKGQPDPIVISTVEAGYETARAQWTLPARFEYRTAKIRIIDRDTAGTPAVLATGGVAQTIITPPPTAYNIGQLVDGRVLATDSDGHNYQFEIIGAVDGVTDSLPATQNFATISLAGGGGILTCVYNFSRSGGGLGINQFSIPIGAGLSSGGTPITNVRELVAAINTFARANVVDTFGWWDDTNQVPVGYRITYPGGTATFTATGGAPDIGTNPPVIRDRAYQVYVNAAVSSFTLTGTRGTP